MTARSPFEVEISLKYTDVLESAVSVAADAYVGTAAIDTTVTMDNTFASVLFHIDLSFILTVCLSHKLRIQVRCVKRFDKMYEKCMKSQFGLKKSTYMG